MFLERLLRRARARARARCSRRRRLGRVQLGGCARRARDVRVVAAAGERGADDGERRRGSRRRRRRARLRGGKSFGFGCQNFFCQNFVDSASAAVGARVAVVRVALVAPPPPVVVPRAHGDCRRSLRAGDGDGRAFRWHDGSGGVEARPRGLFLVACVIFGGGDLAARLGLIRGEDDGGFAGGFGRGVRQRAGRGLGRRRGDFVVDGPRGIAVGCEVQRDVLHRVELRRARVERFVRPLSDVVVGFPRGRFAREIRLPVGDGVGEDPYAALLLAVLAAMLISMLRGALRRRRRGSGIGSRGHGCGDRRLASSERWREISAVSQKNARGSEETKKSRQRRGGERAGGKLGCRSRSIPGCHVGTTAIETRDAAHSLRRRLTGSTSIGLSSSRCPRRFPCPRSLRASTSCRRPSAPAPRQVPTASPDPQNR